MSLIENLLVDDWDDRLFEVDVVDIELFLPDSPHSKVPVSARNNSSDGPGASQAKHSGVLFRDGDNNISADEITSIAWRMMGDTITLEPLNLNGRAQGYSLLRIRSPGGIIDQCVALSRYGNDFVLDFLSEQGFLYTIQLPFTQFIPGVGVDLSGPTDGWRSIKQPFAFDLLTPLSLKAISASLIVAPVIDGSLVGLERQTPLGVMNSWQFADQFSPTGFSRLLRGSSDRVPGHSKLSVRAAMSLIVVDNTMITLSANNTIKTWSIDTKSAIQEITSPINDASLFKTVPGKYLAADEKHVAAYVPASDSGKISNGAPRFEFFVVEDASSATPQIHSAGAQGVISVPAAVEKWFLVDFLLQINEKAVQIIGAWKSSFSSSIYSASADIIDPEKFGEISYREVVRSEPPEIDIPSETDIEKFTKHVFNSGSYSHRTIRDALPEYAPGTKIDESSISLKEAVTRIVAAQASEALDESQRSTRFQWLRLERLVSKIEANKRELLSLSYDPTQNVIWSIRGSYYGVLLPATALYSLVDGANSPHDKTLTTLVSAVKTLHTGLPRHVTSQFESVLMKDVSEPMSDLLADRMQLIMSDIIAPSLSEEDIRVARNLIGSVNELDVLLPALLDQAFPNYTEDSAARTNRQTLTPLGADVQSQIISQYADSAALFLSQFLLVVVIAYNDGWLNDGVRLYSRALALYKTSQSIIALHEPLSNSGVGSGYNPRALALNVWTSELGLKVSKSHGLDQIVVKLWNLCDVSGGSSSAYKLFMRLVEEGFKSNTLTNLSRYVPRDTPGTFVTACAYLSEKQYALQGARLAKQIAIPMARNKYEELSFIDAGIGEGSPAYFLLLARLAEKLGAERPDDISPGDKQHLVIAVGFAKTAALGGDVAAASQMFRLANELKDRYLSYEAICLLHDAGSNIKQELVAFLATSIRAGHVKFVEKELPYLGFSDQFREVLLSQVNFDQQPSSRILYTWSIAHEDFVGAAAAVYRRIVKLRNQTSRSREAALSAAGEDLFDLYTIAMNALKLSAEEDRWFLYSDRIIDYKTIREELDQHMAEMAKSLEKIM